MQLTRAADYAIRVMIYLAGQPEGAVVSKSVLAQTADAPESFLSKILQSLARAGLIQARRGTVGGFTLLSRGAGSSLRDVVEAIDGPIALNVCLTSGDACHRHPECTAHDVWVRAQEAMLSVLSDAKISDLAPGKQGSSSLLNITGTLGSNDSSQSADSNASNSAFTDRPRTTDVRRYASQAANKSKGPVG
jgi:Rrf2 family protein